MTRIALHRSHVVSVRSLTPRMQRVTLGGLQSFDCGYLADERFTLILPPSGSAELRLPASVDSAEVFGERPLSATLRTFTVRRFDPQSGELDFDLSLHAGGVASEWAMRAGPGDSVGVANPRGGYLPPADAKRFVLLGDHAALPAIATILERLPAGSRAHVLVELEDDTDELPLTSAATLECTWLHRRGGRRGAHGQLLQALRAAALDLDGGTAVWAAGELGAMRTIRRHLRDELGLPDSAIEICSFWREHDIELEQAAING